MHVCTRNFKCYMGFCTARRTKRDSKKKASGGVTNCEELVTTLRLRVSHLNYMRPRMGSTTADILSAALLIRISDAPVCSLKHGTPLGGFIFCPYQRLQRPRKVRLTAHNDAA